MTINAPEVLRRLIAQGVQLEVVEGSKLRYDIPEGMDVAKTLAEIRAVKVHLISLIGEPAYWSRAPRERWCQSCHDAADRGERVLLCQQCDMPREAS